MFRYGAASSFPFFYFSSTDSAFVLSSSMVVLQAFGARIESRVQPEDGHLRIAHEHAMLERFLYLVRSIQQSMAVRAIPGHR